MAKATIFSGFTKNTEYVAERLREIRMCQPTDQTVGADATAYRKDFYTKLSIGDKLSPNVSCPKQLSSRD
jgi:hypothetical protein